MTVGMLLLPLILLQLQLSLSSAFVSNQHAMKLGVRQSQSNYGYGSGAEAACTFTSLGCSSFGSLGSFGHVRRIGLGLQVDADLRNRLGFRYENMALSSSFYGDFEDFENGDDDDDDDDDDDEEDDDFIDFDDSAVANFKAKMGIEESDEKSDDLDEEDDDDDDDYEPEIIGDENLASVSSIDELISFATSKSGGAGEDSDVPSTEWANPVDISDVGKALGGGVVLVANPAKFCDDFAEKKPPSAALLSKFGLTLPPPPELGPDRRADLLPVLLLLDRHPLKGCHALLLNRRTGYLIGDLEQQQLDDEDGNNSSPPPNLGAFMIQPLWFGGTSSGGEQSGPTTNGLDMIHLCPAVDGAKMLTEDGLYYGGDPSQAQDAMSDPELERPMTGFDFKFFVQSTRWLPMQLEKEIRDGSWFAASVSKEVVFKSRDRLGAKRAKPLWTEVMELMGGEFQGIRDQLYKEEE
eukprot:CAMPEP_0194109288 /NCGR_PEP_ID=MMETSP0150-20130528/8812_1 /TAXON_ID=122233 /ORGANISM="Chaetoceros debilis, Strain MM31A-1" /LENGTH=464 /DNA_ID=CAMNT_0038798215 /DNA_START=225 /DNA_END=1619 /DNA_ORIENTATION=-